MSTPQNIKEELEPLVYVALFLAIPVSIFTEPVHSASAFATIAVVAVYSAGLTLALAVLYRLVSWCFRSLKQAKS